MILWPKQSNLLNIVAKSLYSEKEVFIRELISNSSDAIEKLKYAQLSQAQSAENLNQTIFEIKLDANDITNTLTIQVISKRKRSILTAFNVMILS
jgi:HSP90 family molecular chaperone